MDNAHSFAGMYGLANPVVGWLINRGYGELVALTPEEMHQAPIFPYCASTHEGDPPRMLWRGSEWVCYNHDPPIRCLIPMRLQNIPPPPFKTWDVIGKEVSVEYRRDDNEARASWKWLVDGEVVPA